MEETKPTPVHTPVPPPPGKKKTTTLLTIIIVVLVAACGYLFYQLSEQKKQTVKYEEVQGILEEEKSSLTGELKDLMEEYESLKSNNDSMNVKLQEQQNRIKKLLGVNTANLETIKLYKKELVTLREVMKSYIVQIDSLNQRNQILMAENTEVKTKLDQARTANKELTDQKDELSTKVQQASILAAKNIIITPLNRRSKENIKSEKVVKIKTCFTIRENSIVKAGPRTVYLRIARPDELVLTASAENHVEFQGEQMVYTEKRDLEYDNADIDMCIFYDVKNGELTAGTYSIDLFCDGNLIGSNTFTLK
jgi:hypothetical protein